VGGILLYDFDEVQLAFLIQAEEKNYASGN
jgi:hypothetical protein